MLYDWEHNTAVMCNAVDMWRTNLFNPLNAELNPICHFLALLGAHHILRVSRIRVNFSYIWSLICFNNSLTVITIFEKCALLGHYAASGSNFLQTFQYYLSVASSRFKNAKKKNHVAPIRSLYREEHGGEIHYRRFGSTYQSHPQGSRMRKKIL